MKKFLGFCFFAVGLYLLISKKCNVDVIEDEVELNFSLMDLDEETVSNMEESWGSLIEMLENE